MSIEVELAKLCRMVGDLCAQNNETLKAIVKDLELVRAQVIINSPIGIRSIGIGSAGVIHVVDS